MASAEEIGRRIRDLRKSADLTQEDFAAAVGIARSTLASVETGAAALGLASTVAIADYFKVPLDWLIGRVVPPGGPLAPYFVDDPDELGWLMFWRELNDEQRSAVLTVLRLPLSAAKALSR
jgi:transcriptional regulator with XRE-family HTH domain